MDYISQTEKIIEYIEEHLKDSIDCDDVIRQSFYSKTHFYRIFGYMVGMSLSEYIRKRRLSCAAIDLHTTSKRLIDIACEYDFGSQEVFTRAFLREYGVTPGKMRKDHIYTELYQKLNLRQNIASEMYKLADYEAVPFVAGNIQLTGICGKVNPGPGKIAHMWDVFTGRLGELEMVEPEKAYGICEYVPDLQDDGTFEYMCAVETKEDIKVPSGMFSRKLNANTYIKICHDGSKRSLKETYRLFYGVWLPVSDYLLLPCDTVEVYNSEQSTMEIWIPVTVNNVQVERKI